MCYSYCFSIFIYLFIPKLKYEIDITLFVLSEQENPRNVGRIIGRKLNHKLPTQDAENEAVPTGNSKTILSDSKQFCKKNLN